MHPEALIVDNLPLVIKTNKRFQSIQKLQTCIVMPGYTGTHMLCYFLINFNSSQYVTIIPKKIHFHSIKAKILGVLVLKYKAANFNLLLSRSISNKKQGRVISFFTFKFWHAISNMIHI